MAAQIVTLSCTKEQKEFLEQFGLSPSEIFQEKINELQRLTDKTQKEIDDLTRKLQSWREMAEIRNRFLHEKGYYGDFEKWKEVQDGNT